MAAVLLASAVWLLGSPPPDARVRRLLRPARERPRRAGPSVMPMVAGALAGLATLVLVGGVIGILAAAVLLVAVPKATSRLESRASRQRREELERLAPLAVDLLAAALASGATMRASLGATAAAIGDPMREALRPVITALDLGADAAAAWSCVDDVPALQPAVEAVVRSAHSGAPLAQVLSRIAEDMRRDRQRGVEVAARSAGVRAVAPLAACFLPAFLLVGVVPVVASLAGALLDG